MVCRIHISFWQGLVDVSECSSIRILKSHVQSVITNCKVTCSRNWNDDSLIYETLVDTPCDNELDIQFSLK